MGDQTLSQLPETVAATLSPICRQQLIVEWVQRSGFVTTEQMVQHFDVTPQTIRRDLSELSKKMLISRHHGGAGSITSSTVNAAYAERKVHLHEEKERIAAVVASHIPCGASLFINIGTSTEAVARALQRHKDLKVVTNNLHVAAAMLQQDSFQVVLAGGEVRNRDGGIVGEATRDFIAQFRTDYAVIGISGIDVDGTLMDFDYHEVRVSQTMIANARRTLLVADHSKFGRNAMVRLGHLEDIGTLYTDATVVPELVRGMEEWGTGLIVCNTNSTF